MADSDLVVFGYVSTDTRQEHADKMTAFAAALSRLSKLEVAVCRARSYTEVTELVLKRQVDVAWLPPLPYIALSRRDAVEPLVSIVREGHGEFYSVLVIRPDAPIKTPRDLEGKRAAWVDPHSASGYILPRIGLSAVGLDPRKAFREERFYGSHEKAVRAVKDRRADFAATYGGLLANGTLGRGVWSAGEAKGELSVLATFGAIPPDVIAARSDFPAYSSECILHGFTHAHTDAEAKGLLVELFGATELRIGTPIGYVEFCRATMKASDEGLLEGEEKT